MAEVIAVGASIIAIVQITDRVIGLCKDWIEIWRDAPADLRAVLIEMLTTKTILDGAQFLISCNTELSATLESLLGADGPIEGCRKAITELEGLFPSAYTQGPNGNRSKRQKVKASLAALAWPLNENKARKLLEEVTRHRATISLALTIESTHDTKNINRKTTQIHEILSGAGKTVFASHLIEKTKKYCADSTTGKCAYIYYYCYFGHSQEEAAPFLRWTINRLCREADFVPPCLYQLYKYGGEPSLVDLLHVLEAVLEAFDRVYIVIDAIDESIPRDDLLKVLRDLATDSRFQKIQLLATSREYIDIEKIMQQISVSVSMSNPLVDEDIKLYVRSQLKTNSKFRHWSSNLCNEVVEALSAKAKGMFRWAACQIDVLQRLKAESTIVKNALANLPKTLDETYERVFLGIPEEDRMFVLHAMKWIYFNNELHDADISCSILLQVIERSTCELVSSEQDYFYDEERLRELCGCLITVAHREKASTGYTTRTVSFAHYTVWEFLNSARILNSSAAVFAVTEETRNELTRTVILEVLNTQKIDPWDGKDGYDSFSVHQVVGEHLQSYCVISSIFSLRNWGSSISKQDDLMVFAFGLLNPSKPHFQNFAAAACQIEDLLHVFSDREMYFATHFWDINWKTTPKKTDATTLINLLLLCRDTKLVEKFLENVNMRDVLQTRLDLECKVWSLDAGRYIITHNFKGFIIEILAQLALDIGSDPFRLLLEAGAEIINPSPVLLLFVGSHQHQNCEERCLLSRLLQLGASTNVSRHTVTPLQIAVACWDFEGVKILLEAGADPNSTGNSEGTGFREGSIYAPFNNLHGRSPLHICRELNYIGYDWAKYGRQSATAEIDVILRQFGAKV